MLRQITDMETLGQTDCHDFQEVHSPTTMDTVTEITDNRLRPVHRIVRRRVLDSQLWRTLSLEQQKAAERIEHGYRTIVAGLGARQQMFTPLHGGTTHVNDSTILAYNAWLKECRRLRLPSELALEILVGGYSIAAVAARAKTRRASLRVLFAELLDAYINVTKN